MERVDQWLQGLDHLYAQTHHHSAGEQRASAAHAPQLGLTQVQITAVVEDVQTKPRLKCIHLKKEKKNSVLVCFFRTNWVKAVQMCSKAREFALALAILECAIKPVAMLPVWKDSLGHTRYTLASETLHDDMMSDKRTPQ